MLGALGLLIAGDQPAMAQGSPFAEDQVVHLVVPYKPGGGFDRIARLLQPTFAEKLSAIAGRDVTVIVENRTGAGGRIAYEYVYGSPSDSARMVLIDNQGAALQQVALGADFDLDKFTYIGRVNNSDAGFLMRKNLGIDSFEKLVARAQQTPILFGTGGAGSSDHIALLIIQAVLQEQGVALPLDFVHFGSSREILASLQRDEAEAFLGSASSTLSAVDDGYAANCLVFAEQRSVYAPDVPTAIEQGVPGAEGMTELTRVTRFLVGPPDMPEAHAEALREALHQTLLDPSFLAAAAQAKLPVHYADAEETRTAIKRHADAILAHKAMVKAAIGGQ